MRTIWQSLVWKEWHEHKWKFASIVAILCGTALLSLWQGDADPYGLAVVLVTSCVVPLSLFVGVNAAANERSRRTFAFLQALPVPMWRVALTKLVCGLLTLVASVALTLPIYYAWSRAAKLMGLSYYGVVRQIPGESLTGNWYVDALLLGASIAASLFIWSAATGVNRKDEVSAGAVSFAIMIGWYLALFVVGYVLFEWNESRNQRDQVFEWIRTFGLSTAPAGFLNAYGNLDRQIISSVHWYRFVVLIVFVSSVTHLALAGWYVRRFGRLSNMEVRSPQLAKRAADRPDWLSAPRQSPLTAIVWKQYREVGPLVLAGLSGVTAFALSIFVIDPSHFLSHRDELVQMVWVLTTMIGFAVTLIVGIGVCFYDVGPQATTFWRSRPINPDVWFWSKFATGLAVLIGTFYLPLLAVIALVHPDPFGVLSRHNSAFVVLAANAALFAAAIAMTCIVRHAVYGGILTIPLLYVGIAIEWMSLKLAGAVGWLQRPPVRMIEMSEAEAATGFLITFVICTVFAWLATRYDWGRKSRY